MGNTNKRTKRFFRFLTLIILFCSICMGSAGMTASAKTKDFIVDAAMLPSDRASYDVQIKVENQGPDWEGTVRLMIKEEYYGRFNDCVYDTELSLPQDSTKQFVVRVPKDSIERTDGMVQISLVDRNGEEAARAEFERLLQEEVDALTIGVLSDEYRSLTYLDMGGTEFYYNGKNYPIRLEELDRDGLSDALDALDFLVIDSYDTSVLEKQTLEDIRRWQDKGGAMILGTGEKAAKVLAGFADLEIRCLKVDESGTKSFDYSSYLNTSHLHMAHLMDIKQKYQEGYEIFILLCSQGDGAVAVLPYSLAEVGRLNAAGNYEQQKAFIENMLQQTGGYVSVSQGSGKSSYMDNMYLLEEISNCLGNGSSDLQFGGLKWIVILYVIFVGPILYLILRFMKKRDLYWIAVPVTTLMGIVLVYWAGRGFEVVSTKVYSVTVENLSGGENARTYLRCYDAGHKEWGLRLAEGYEYAGPMEDTSYMSDDGSYYYHIRKEGDRLFFGLNPSMGFEDGYFQAGCVKEPEEGGIYSDLQKSSQWEIRGTVTNETGRDFKYFAVCMGEDLYVYENLPAGADVDLRRAKVVYDNGDGYYGGLSGYSYGFLRAISSGETAKDVDSLTALGMGLYCAYSMEEPDATVIVGVTEDWDKAVDDTCKEVSYGCLYAVQ